MPKSNGLLASMSTLARIWASSAGLNFEPSSPSAFSPCGSDLCLPVATGTAAPTDRDEARRPSGELPHRGERIETERLLALHNRWPTDDQSVSTRKNSCCENQPAMSLIGGESSVQQQEGWSHVRRRPVEPLTLAPRTELIGVAAVLLAGDSSSRGVATQLSGRRPELNSSGLSGTKV